MRPPLFVPTPSTSLTLVTPATFVPLAVLSLLPLFSPFFFLSFPLPPLAAFVPIPLETLFRLVPPAVLLLGSQRPTDHHHRQRQAQYGQYRFCPTRHRQIS
ncbi:MAG: hypothetical protein CMJ69_07485 [Planctomycetaceae bacterium]|nr:hypothetical protein [Planctomycetaceae bacterium]